MAMHFLRRLPFSFNLRIFPFSPQPSKSSQISRCRINDNRVSKLFQEGKCGTLCDVVTHQKAISLKASLQLLCEDISFFTMVRNGLLNITLQNPRQQCRKLFQEGKDGTLSDEVTHQKAISQTALSTYYVTIFPFSPWTPMGSQISLSRFHEKSVSKLLSEV